MPLSTGPNGFIDTVSRYFVSPTSPSTLWNEKSSPSSPSHSPISPASGPHSLLAAMRDSNLQNHDGAQHLAALHLVERLLDVVEPDRL